VTTDDLPGDAIQPREIVGSLGDIRSPPPGDGKNLRRHIENIVA
jgi:hypothetical protein